LKNTPQLKSGTKHTNKVPLLGDQKEANKKIPIIKHTSVDKWKWIFSFKFFNQIKDFGLGESDSKWFVSLLNQLKDLSKVNRKDVLESTAFKKAYRYHKINWKQKNIPIARKDLNWIDKDYLDNEEEYEMYQFQISMALGRIVGFWDENLIFNIVLLDPLHNIQPSSYNAYKVNDTSILTCQYSSLLHDIKKAKSLEEVKSCPTNYNHTDVMMHFVSEKVSSEIQSLLDEGVVNSIEDILELGLAFVKENK